MSAVMINGRLYENGKPVGLDKETLGYVRDRELLIDIREHIFKKESRVFSAEEEEAFRLDSPDLFASYGSLKEYWLNYCGQFSKDRSGLNEFFYDTNQELLASGKEELTSLSGLDRRAALLQYAVKSLNEDMEAQLKILIQEYPVQDYPDKD